MNPERLIDLYNRKAKWDKARLCATNAGWAILLTGVFGLAANQYFHSDTLYTVASYVAITGLITPQVFRKFDRGPAIQSSIDEENANPQLELFPI